MRFPCLGALYLPSWFPTRDDDLDCAPRDARGTPFTPILMKRYLDCSVRGEERCGRVWNSPYASKQFLILYLHLHQITQHSYLIPGLLNYTTRIKSAHSAVVSWCRYQPMLSHWHWLTWLHRSPSSSLALPPIIFRFFSYNGHCDGDQNK